MADADARDDRFQRGEFALARAHFLLDAVNDFLGFADAAMHHEPARAFGDPQPENENREAEQRAETEDEPPAKPHGQVVRVEHVEREDRARCRADPERGINGEIDLAAQACGNQFVDGGIDGGVFAADARAGECTEDRVAPESPRHSRERGGGEVNAERDEEKAFAPETVGEVAEEERADDSARKIRGSRGADLLVAEPEGGRIFERGAERASEGDFEAVENPRDAERGDDHPVPSAPRKTVEARGDLGFHAIGGGRIFSMDGRGRGHAVSTMNRAAIAGWIRRWAKHREKRHKTSYK